MAAQIDNTEVIEETVAGQIQKRDVTSLLCAARSPSTTTLVDGHTVPSKIAATPSPSTKVEKLMDTLSAYFATKRRQSKVIL